MFCDAWVKQTGQKISWVNKSDGGPHEAGFLKLDCTKIKRTFCWRPRWNAATAMEKIVEWASVYYNHGDVSACMEQQIKEFEEKPF